MNAMRDAGFHWSSTIIWAKDSLVLSRKDYHTQYDPFGTAGWRLMPNPKDCTRSKTGSSPTSGKSPGQDFIGTSHHEAGGIGRQGTDEQFQGIRYGARPVRGVPVTTLIAAEQTDRSAA